MATVSLESASGLWNSDHHHHLLSLEQLLTVLLAASSPAQGQGLKAEAV
jgi:hypothetical protein